VQLFFPFWPPEALSGISNNWMQGWSIAPALAFWHHVTILLLPGKLSSWRRVRIIVVYLLAGIAIVQQTQSHIIFTSGSSPLFMNSLRAGQWYLIFVAAMVISIWTCVLNLFLAARHAPTSSTRKQLNMLAWASLTAGLAGFISIAATYFLLPVPILVVSLLEALPVALIGLSVFKYGAFMEMRINQKDFLYNLSLLGFVLLIYIPISLYLIKVYHAPMAVLAVFPALAVITHTSMAAIYRFMDRFFYQRDIRQVRITLRQLWRNVGVNGTLEALLEPAIETVCRTVDASYGLILTFEDNSCRKVVGYHQDENLPELEISKLTVDDAISLKPGHLPAPMDDASLLVPLYGEVDQLGALILGRPVNGYYYAPEDIDQVLEFTDQIADTIQSLQRNSKYMAEILRIVQAHTEPAAMSTANVSGIYLESALRTLYDYTSLADNPLAELKLVQSRLPDGVVTHLERGKMLQAVILEALKKLQPALEMHSNPPPREWYPYLILQEAYVKETSNRDIMSKLYISEGTFNRTRRMAIRSLARALGEMEAAIS
jgi:hypothetical protein